MADAVYEPIAYTLGGVLGIVVIVIIILMVIAYRRFVPVQEYVEPETKPAKPPDGTIGYPYPGYTDYMCPPPPEPDPGVILVPPILAPLPPADYAVEGGMMPTPEGFVLPLPQPEPPPPPPCQPPPPPCEPEPQPNLKIVKPKRKKKKPKRVESSSSSSSSSSSCDCDSDSCGEYHGCHSVMTPSMMMLVQPAPQPPPVTVFTSAPQLAGRGIEDQTRQAVVGAVQTPCTGPPCF